MIVTHNTAADRFEIDVEGGPAVLTYTRRDGTVVFTHTEVPEEAEGRGIGKALVAAGLEWARGETLAVVPSCPFVAAYMAERPDTHDLVPAAERKWLDPDYDEPAR